MKTIAFFVVPDNQAPDFERTFRVIIKPHNPVTTCTIEWAYSSLMTFDIYCPAFGISVCRPEDVFSLETGCRLALQSAMRMTRREAYPDESNAALHKALWAAFAKIEFKRTLPVHHNCRCNLIRKPSEA